MMKDKKRSLFGNVMTTVTGLLLLISSIEGTDSCTVDALVGKYRYQWVDSTPKFGGDGGAATSADLSYPRGAWVTPSNELLIADEKNTKIRKVNTNAIISTIAGGGTSDEVGHGEGGPAVASTNQPFSLCVDSTGVIYVIDQTNFQIRRIGTDSIIANFVGVPMFGDGYTGFYDDSGDLGDNRPATSAFVLSPSQCFVDSNADFYFVDEGSTVVRKVTVNTGIITLYAGITVVPSGADRLRRGLLEAQPTYGLEGKMTSVWLLQPNGMFIDSAGNMFVAEFDSRVRKIVMNTGMLKTYAGFTGPNSGTMSGDGGPATSAGFDGIGQMITFDTHGNMFLSGNLYVVRFVKASTGIVTRIAGNLNSVVNGGPGDFGGDGGPATSAYFFHINFMNTRGNEVILADRTNAVIRKLTCDIANPTSAPTTAPTAVVTATPSALPTTSTTELPTAPPTAVPTIVPTALPSFTPSQSPTATPSEVPTMQSSATPSVAPSVQPTATPSATPSEAPSVQPSASPSERPSVQSTATPSATPSEAPSMQPSATPSEAPSVQPSASPSETPSVQPTAQPTATPSATPSVQPSATPSETPSAQPTAQPTATPSATPSVAPTMQPSATPSETPSAQPTATPSATPSETPSAQPAATPSATPSETPSAQPTATPSATPRETPSAQPTATPSETPSETPSMGATFAPSVTPSAVPSNAPSPDPSQLPTIAPSDSPSAAPSNAPIEVPSIAPSTSPSNSPTAPPSEAPSISPSSAPSESPSATPSVAGTLSPTVFPSITPSESPSICPSAVPSKMPSQVPTTTPSVVPTAVPSVDPTMVPSEEPSYSPSHIPSPVPSVISIAPTKKPSTSPTVRPTRMPSAKPTFKTFMPTAVPPTDITFDATLFLHNVSASTLNLPAQNAVCGAAAVTVGVEENKCVFVGQSNVGARRRLAAPTTSFTIKAVVRLAASTTDFEDTAEDTNGDNLYAKLTTLLETAVETKAFTQAVRDKSVEFNAVDTLNVGNVTFEASPFTVVVPGEKDDDLTTGEFSGVVIGVIAAALLALTLMWVCATECSALSEH